MGLSFLEGTICLGWFTRETKGTPMCGFLCYFTHTQKSSGVVRFQVSLEGLQGAVSHVGCLFKESETPRWRSGYPVCFPLITENAPLKEETQQTTGFQKNSRAHPRSFFGGILCVFLFFQPKQVRLPANQDGLGLPMDSLLRHRCPF